MLIAFGLLGENVWNGENGFKGIGKERNCRCEIVDGNLRFTEIKVDCGVMFNNVAIEPAECNAFIYKYRAEGTGTRGGQIFYARKGERLNDSHCWRLPALISDGKWHSVTVYDKNLKQVDDWKNGGVIDSFRLDLTDSEGGRIELAEFMFAKVVEPAAKAAAPKKAFLVTTEKPFWNKDNAFAGMHAQRNVTVERNSEGLQISFDKSDGQIAMEGVQLDPERCNTLVYTYRAVGTGPAGGQLYFAHAKDNISADKFWSLPPMKPDGKWHTVKLNFRRLSDAYEWFKNGDITKLRLDPTDSEGGRMFLSDIHFEYIAENHRNITKQQPLPNVAATLDTEEWPPVKPGYISSADEYKDGVTSKYFSCKMITSPDDARGRGTFTTFYMRKTFDLPSAPVSAWVQFTGDDAATAYVNGSKVASHGNWRVACSAEVTKLLHAGRNVLGYEYTNTDSYGGVFGELFIRLQDGTCVFVNTDKDFTTAVNVPGDWCRENYDAKGWKAVLLREGPPHHPWNSRLDYIDFRSPAWGESFSVEPRIVRAGEKMHIVETMKGELPRLPFEGFVLMRLKRNKVTVWKERMIFSEKEVKQLDNGRWKVELDYEAPLYFGDMDVEFSLEGGNLFGVGTGYAHSDISIRRLDKVPGYEKKPSFKVKDIGGTPSFTLNGKPFYPLWGAVWWARRKDMLPIHSPADANLVTLNTNDSQWNELEEIMPEVYDRSAEMYRRYNPNAYFMVNIPFYPPRKAFLAEYADEMCLDDEGKINMDGRLCYSFTSKRTLELFKRHLDRIFNYLESSPYANRIVGYRIVGGHTIEWLGWDPRPFHTVDFSPASKAAFKEYMNKYYPDVEDCSIPTMDEREELDGEDILWNPEKHKKVIAFYNFYSECISNYVIELGKCARKIVGPDKVLGTYQGYTMTLGASGNAQLRAHYDFKRILDAGVYDFFMSPQPYRVRNIGDPMGDMKPFSSIAANGAIPVIEDDTRTCSGPAGLGYFQTPNIEMTVNVLKRNYSTVLCRNTPAYFYSLSSGIEYDFPEAGAVLDRIRGIGQHCLEKAVPRKAEIAIVVSETAIKSMPVLKKGARTRELMQSYNPDGTVRVDERAGTVFTQESMEANYIKYSCIGAPVDYILAEDMKDHPGDYKLYIFSNCITYDDAFLAAIAGLRRRNCTLLWMYAPGYAFNGKASVESMKQLTGFEFERADVPLMPAVTFENGKVMGTQTIRLEPMFSTTSGTALGKYENGKVGLAKMRTGSALSYFSGVWQFDVPFLMDVAREAGVHIFTETHDPVEANGALFTLHARHSGKKTVHLPKKADVLDVFSNKIVARGTDTFTFDAPLHSTHLFYFGDDAKSIPSTMK